MWKKIIVALFKVPIEESPLLMKSIFRPIFKQRVPQKQKSKALTLKPTCYVKSRKIGVNIKGTETVKKFIREILINSSHILLRKKILTRKFR